MILTVYLCVYIYFKNLETEYVYANSCWALRAIFSALIFYHISNTEYV